jgi:hypothetical protein
VLIVNSTSGLNLSEDGSSFDVIYNPPIELPAKSNPRLSIIEASTWFQYPNLMAKYKNTKLFYTSDPANPTMFTINFADGMYDIDGINDALKLQLEANGHEPLLFRFIGDDSTNRVILYKNASTTAYQFCFMSNMSPSYELGFESGAKYPPTAPTTEDFSYTAPNAPNLNSISNILVHCSLVQGSSYVNSAQGAALCSFTPGDSGPGQLIEYRSYFDVPIGCAKMAGQPVSLVSFWITDQSGKRGSIDTFTQPWGATFKLEWD